MRFIAMHRRCRAGTLLRRVVVVATRTGVHRCYQRKSRRVVDAILRPRYCYMSIFEWLAQHLQDVTSKLWHLIQEENSVIRQRHLTRLWRLSSTYKCHLRCQVMRSAKWSLGYKSLVCPYLSRYGVYLCGFECLVERHRRKYRRHTSCEHRLSRAWRAYHNDVMSSRRGNLQRTLHVGLSLHIREVLTKLILLRRLATYLALCHLVGYPTFEYLA